VRTDPVPDVHYHRADELIERLERAWASGRLPLSVEQFARVGEVLFPELFGGQDAAEVLARAAAERAARPASYLGKDHGREG
jgi:hypothetical protein